MEIIVDIFLGRYYTMKDLPVLAEVLKAGLEEKRYYLTPLSIEMIQSTIENIERKLNERSTG